MPTTTPPLSGDFSIVKDGKATSTIVISTNASDKVREAAEDLQASIQKMSGATIPIGYDSADRTNGNFILVGPSKYTELLGIEQPTGYPDNEKVILKRAGNYLVLMGTMIMPLSAPNTPSPCFWRNKGVDGSGRMNSGRCIPAHRTSAWAPWISSIRRNSHTAAPG